MLSNNLGQASLSSEFMEFRDSSLALARNNPELFSCSHHSTVVGNYTINKCVLNIIGSVSVSITLKHHTKSGMIVSLERGN
jgi:hypothetical protein